MKRFVMTVVLLLAASAAMAQQGGGCAALAFRSPQAGGDFQTTFSATKIIDLELVILFHSGSGSAIPPGMLQGLNDTHVLELRIFTPRGNLYQSTQVAFTADSSKKNSFVRLDSYRQPQQVQLLSDITFQKNKQVGVVTTLPVAGTPIIQNSLYGLWRAEAYVDDQRLPCSKAATFTITQ
jgi:hypothetical protein